jgi:ribosomal protein L32
MAVPKKRTSKAAKGQRRSHDAIKPEQLVTEPTSGLVVPRRLYRAAQKGVARLAGKR